MTLEQMMSSRNSKQMIYKETFENWDLPMVGHKRKAKLVQLNLSYVANWFSVLALERIAYLTNPDAFTY